MNWSSKYHSLPDVQDSLFGRKLYLLYMFLWCFCNGITPLSAHESRPIFVQIMQSQPQHIVVSYAIPNTIDYRNLPQFDFGASFQEDTTQRLIKSNAQAYQVELHYTGYIQSLHGKSIPYRFPYFNPTLSTVVEIYFTPEQPDLHVLNPNQTALDLTQESKENLQSNAFIGLGVEHIFKGYDHLLFVLCLLMVTGVNKKLFWTITGFTLAHSITLGLSVLNLVNLPVPFVEACIALSIVFLSCEIVKQVQKNQSMHTALKQSVTYQYPVLISSGFGLLHGLGFAAVLKEIGLPEANLVQALLYFNIGVEIGQIAFVMSIIAGMFGLNLLAKNADLDLQKYSNLTLKWSAYAIGIIASFWLFERMLAWF